MSEIFLKELIPNGEGEFSVHRFAYNTDEAANAARDMLLVAGWAEANAEDWNLWTAAVPGVAAAIKAVRQA